MQEEVKPIGGSALILHDVQLTAENMKLVSDSGCIPLPSFFHLFLPAEQVDAMLQAVMMLVQQSHQNGATSENKKIVVPMKKGNTNV